MRPIVNGTLGPVRGRTRVSYDPIQGLQVAVPWESAGNNLGGVARAYQRQRISYDWEPNERKSTLVAKLSGGQAGVPNVAVDEWQIIANETQKSLFEHPRSLDISDEDIKAIQEGLSDNSSAADVPVTGDALILYRLLQRGTTHFALGQYVLRHTTNVANSYSQNVADINIERIYTTASLLGEVTNANLWNFPLPGRLVFKIQSIDANAQPPARVGYAWGWRKLPSTETTAAGNRIALTTEYWLEQWSNYIYGAAI